MEIIEIKEYLRYLDNRLQDKITSGEIIWQDNFFKYEDIAPPNYYSMAAHLRHTIVQIDQYLLRKGTELKKNRIWGIKAR